MKTATTPFGIEMQEKIQINRDFLLSEGWKLEFEKPLFEVFSHPGNSLLKCSIGFHGELSITEKHWCNDEPEKGFFTINPYLTKEEYFKIIQMLRIEYRPK